MRDRLMLVLAGLVGFSVYWILDREGRKESRIEGPGFWERVSRDWLSLHPVAGPMGRGFLFLGFLGLISVGLIGYGS
ncbi:MAG TPA: hypothetical protein VEB69_14820 [Acidimicrobiia bacterium]|nr:hypothetical protein [Acidimicrobiia bacterium]